MRYLIVVAHPDDEVLGVGGTIYKLVKAGEEVNVCILSTEAKARAFRPKDFELSTDIDSCFSLLGITKKIEKNFLNIQFNNEPHLKLVQAIEQAIMDTQADVVITHHPADTNNDHLHTSMACQAAIRLFQRRDDVKPIEQLLFMEVLSSTEWNVNSAMNSFTPNTFIKIGKEGVDMKLKALSQYRGVMRKYPHPRSQEAIEGLAAYRGAQAGLYYAEAFESVFKRGF